MKKSFIILAYLLSPVLLIIAIFTSHISKYSTSSFFIPMVLGVLSYTWILWQLVLSARPKFIEKHFGLDKMYRFHGMIAIIAIGFGIVHKLNYEAIFRDSIMTKLGEIALVIFIIVSMISIIFMWTRVLDKFAYLKRVVVWMKKLKVITYERLKLMHNLTIIGILMLQVHVMMTSAARASILVFNVYMGYFLVAMSFYIYHKSIKAWLLEEHHYTISAIYKETSDVISLDLEPKTLFALNFKPGQFGYFTFLSKNIPIEEHPFSISSSPTEKSKLTITVKALGDFTHHLSNTMVGDEVRVEGPFGRFSYMNAVEEKSTVFIAGGIGITPLMSMLKHIEILDENRHVILIWAVKTKNDFIKYKTFTTLEQNMAHFSFIPIVSNDNQWTGRKGRLELDVLKDILIETSFLDGNTGYYICGSSNFMKSVLDHLQTIGIPRKQVYYEKFTV